MNALLPYIIPLADSPNNPTPEQCLMHQDDQYSEIIFISVHYGTNLSPSLNKEVSKQVRGMDIIPSRDMVRSICSIHPTKGPMSSRRKLLGPNPLRHLVHER